MILNSVIKASAYVLVHAPDMLHYGSSVSNEILLNPDSEFLKQLDHYKRSYEEACSYYPNQVYIGNLHPNELKKIEGLYYEQKMPNAKRMGKFGEIMPQDEFLLLMQSCDAFDLIVLEENFVSQTIPKLQQHALMQEELISKIKAGVTLEEIKTILQAKGSSPIYHDNQLVGVIKNAHDIDPCLTAHVLFENLASKASCVLSVLHLINNAGIDRTKIDYIIECSEEACGDMNQRGGGNIAKSVAESAGLLNATGCDVRAFCAGPAHALVNAAALVSSGTYENVLVAAGGSTAKLAMNAKDHIKKNIPILEDVIGGFAVLVSKNDGIHPEINLQILGRHTVSTGSAPQAVISSLTTEPLNKAGLSLKSIDKYAVEMQNPEITKPAGAGDVPLANYKMIAALAVKTGEIDRGAMNDFIDAHGMPGWAPTQGHIPSGVPAIGFACEDMMNDKINNMMLIGKGSLFLGRMTNSFDGISFVIQKNTGTNKTEFSESALKEAMAKAMREFAKSLLKEDACE